MNISSPGKDMKGEGGKGAGIGGESGKKVSGVCWVGRPHQAGALD